MSSYTNCCYSCLPSTNLSHILKCLYSNWAILAIDPKTVVNFAVIQIRCYLNYTLHNFIGEPESMEVEKWEEDEEVAMDVDMDKASMIEMFDSVSVT